MSQQMDEIVQDRLSKSQKYKEDKSKKKSKNIRASDSSSNSGNSPLLKPKQESKFKRWLKKKFTCCFGQTNQVTDLTSEHSDFDPRMLMKE